jgi:hypothetical protein
MRCLRMACCEYSTTGMNNYKILDDLLALLDAHGVTIRMESLDESPGGLCRLHETNILFLDTNRGADHQIQVCAGAILKLIDIATVYLKPEVRQLLESFQNKEDKSI